MDKLSHMFVLFTYVGTTVKYVLEQDKIAFMRLIGISVLQSAANSIVAPSLRHVLSAVRSSFCHLSFNLAFFFN